MQYRRLLHAAPPGQHRIPRPAAGRDGAAARRPPPGRRLLGRLLAREHAVPARRRPDPGVPRGRRDERDRTRRCRTASGRSTSTSSSRTSPSGSPTSPPTWAARTTMDGAIDAAAVRPDAVRGGLARAVRPARAVPGDRRAIRARLRRLNDLGFSVDLEVDPVGPARVGPPAHLGDDPPLPRERARAADAGPRRSRARPGCCSTTSREYPAWLEFYERRQVDAEEAADRWLREVYRPTLARIAGLVGPDRDLVQAYCDVLEHKWLLSERAGRDVGLDAAIESYLAEGAPAPERRGARCGGGPLDAIDALDALDRLDADPDEIGYEGRRPERVARQARPCPARPPRWAGLPALAVDDLVQGPAAAGPVRRREDRRVRRVAERQDVLAAHARRVAERAHGRGRGRRPWPGSCRCRAPRRRASSGPPRHRGPR